MEYLLPAILLIIVFVFAFRAYEIKQLEKRVMQRVMDSILVMYTETEGNTLYLYEKDTNQFQCQASTMTELAKNLLAIKNIQLAKINHDSKELWFVDGDILDEIEFEINPKE
jgi:hypothetical protein